MTDETMQVHFQYGKRASLTGANACFDHTEYITSGRGQGRDQTEIRAAENSIEDEIPYTTLNVCHKNGTDRKRC